MTTQKFEQEIGTLKSFFEVFCKDKHQNQCERFYFLEYKDEKFELKVQLCQDCHGLLNYSFSRLLNCPHEIKPRCRKCPNPCYEQEQWKKVAKLMKYSGLKHGLISIKKFLGVGL